MILDKILSNCFINNVNNESGYMIMDTRGTKSIFIMGLNIFISKKLFISMGIDVIKAIVETVNILDIYFFFEFIISLKNIRKNDIV